MKNEKIKETLIEVVQNLSAGNYLNVYNNDLNKRLSINDMKRAINEYKGIINLPPLIAYDKFYDYDNEYSEENFIEFNLWFDGEESDLTLSVTIYEKGGYSIEDIRVL